MTKPAVRLSAEEIALFERDLSVVHDGPLLNALHRLRATIAAQDDEIAELMTSVKDHEECIGELEYAAENAELEARLEHAQRCREAMVADLMRQRAALEAKLREATEWSAQLTAAVPRWPNGTPVTQSAFDEFYGAKEAVEAKLREAESALVSIMDLRQRPYDGFPADWRQQIAACSECQRWTGHPIQRGICDEHRKPLYARERHDADETDILGLRAKEVAREALRALQSAQEEQ